jgi:putative ABC transport system substrate-binding protein
MTRRRAFALMIAAPLVGRAQPTSKVWRIAYLGNNPPAASSLTTALLDAFHAGMREAGHHENVDYVLEARYGEGRTERYLELAAQAIAGRPDVLVAAGTPASLALRTATSTTPIVMIVVSDPVGSGLVTTLARPGRNVTGFTDISPQLDEKRLELMRDIAPATTRLAVLWNSAVSYHAPSMAALAAAAGRHDVQILRTELRGTEDVDAALRAVERLRPNALMVLDQPAVFALVGPLVELAARLRIPSVFPQKAFASAGGLMSYGADYADLARRAAGYVARIIKGAKAGDLPVEQPAKFELVINARTAHAIGLAIPSSILVRADEVIR